MGQLLRSEEMTLLRMYIKVCSLCYGPRWYRKINCILLQVEVAHETLEELGELGVVEFKDVRQSLYAHHRCCALTLTIQLNSGVGGFQRTFANDIKRCDEMERRVRLV